MNTIGPFRKAKATDATDTSFPSRIPTITAPSGDGVHILASDGGGSLRCSMKVIPYGTGDANDVFDMRIIGWRSVLIESNNIKLWIPSILAGLTCTLGAATGVAGAPLPVAAKFVDTITVTSGMEPTITSDTTRDGTLVIFSPTGDLIAWAEIPLYGVERVEFTFDTTTGDPTGANALFALI